MRRIYRWVIHHKAFFIILFLVAAAAGLVLKQLVDVDYDINDYLPPETASTVAIDVMQEEYEGGIPNARVMIRDVSVAEALEYKERLRQVDGVTDVTWLDDAVTSVYVPLETMDEKTLETYYQDGCALFSVTIDEEKCVEAVEALRAVIGDGNAMSGSAVSTATATSSTVSEVQTVTVVGVLFTLFVLLLTTGSWFEPVIVLGSLGVAIAINSGTNLMFGTISFVSNSAGNILQLAVSLDYSVFLMHRFDECRRTCEDIDEAMVEALCSSTTSILSSGLTTVIGFLALCIMSFQIGPDLGLVLAKGVAISLITVFVFSPSVILWTRPLMDRLRHKSFMPPFKKLGRAVTKLMLPMVAVFVILIYPAIMASSSNSYYFGASHIFGPETQLGRDTDAIEEIFGKSDTYVLLVPRGHTATEKELSTELKALNEVTSIISYVDSAGEVIPMGYVAEDTLSKLESAHYSRMVLSVAVSAESDKTFSLVQTIRDIAERYYPGEWLLAGGGVSTYDLKTTVLADMTKVNLIAILAVFVTLLFSFKSISIPVILVLAIETAIWINSGIPYMMGSSVFYIAYLIISSIQLGATVDYAILLTDRYLGYRQTQGRKDAIRSTISAVTVSVLTSGSAMTVVGFLLGKLSTHGLLSQLGYFLSRGTVCSMIIVLFVLPGLLYLLDGPIQHTTRGLKLYRERNDASPERRAKDRSADRIG